MQLPLPCFFAAVLFFSTVTLSHAEETSDDAAVTQKVLAVAKTVKHTAIETVPPAPAAPAPAATATITTVTTTNICGEVGSMDRMLMKQRKLAFLATSIDKAEAVHIYFIIR